MVLLKLPKGHNSHNEHQNNEHNEHQNNHLKELKMLITSWKGNGGEGKGVSYFFKKPSEVIC